MNIKKIALISGIVSILSACVHVKYAEQDWCRVCVKPETETINLSADALFHFDKSSSKDLLPEGRASLDKLVQQITDGYVSIDRIDLVGHTDRLGSHEYNQRLGEARADTVRTYLTSRGISAPITASSAGETQPITTNCQGNIATPSLTHCLQPDRRVTVSITGVRKGKSKRTH